MCIQYIYTVHRYTVSVKVMLLHMVIVKVRVNVKVCQSLCSAVHLFTLLPPTEELNSLMTRGEKGVFQSVCPALWKEQPVAEPAPPAADDSVQRVAGIVQNAPQFVESSPLCHCHQRVQLHADH